MADQSRTIEPTMNLLLNAMGHDARAELLEKSRRTPIEVGRVLFRPGDAVTYVPFPLIGTLSLLAQPDDMPVEAATIGNEGAAKLPSALGSGTASQELIGQVAGEMITVPIETFTKHVQEEDRFRDLSTATSRPWWSRSRSRPPATPFTT